MANYIAVDLGAESGRVMLVRLVNEKIAIEEVHRFPNGPATQGDSLRWDIDRLFGEIKTGLKKAFEIEKDIQSIGLDTWGVDFGLIDADGNLLENPYHYRDDRNIAMFEKAGTILAKEDIYMNTGIQFMPFNSLYQLMAYKEYSPEVLEKADKLLLMPNLLMYLLTGEVSAEYTMASTSQMMDMNTGNWSKKIIDAFELPENILPPITQPGEAIGKLKQSLADEFGCGDVSVVAVGCHDTASAVAAVPVSGDKPWAYLSSGTWSLMGIETPEAIINDTTYQVQFTNEGGVYDTIRFLKNIMGLWLFQQSRAKWIEQGSEYDYGQLTEMAQNAKPFAAYIDVDQSEFMTIGDMPQKINDYLKSTGQNEITDKGQMARAILESLAEKYCHVVDRLEKLSGEKIETLHIVGGGTKNQLLNQLAADSTGKTIVTGPIEATVLGNILVQAIASGEISDLQHGRKIVAESFDVEKYTPQNAQGWVDYRQNFANIIKK